MFFAAKRKRIKAGFHRFIKILGMNHQFPVAAPRRCNPAAEPNRRRQHKTVVVVRVLPDEIHPARGTVNSGRRTKARAETFRKLESVFQWPVLFQICFVLLAVTSAVEELPSIGAQRRFCHDPS